jgi:hypothetical protein
VTSKARDLRPRRLLTATYNSRTKNVGLPHAIDGITPGEDGNAHARLPELLDVSVVSLTRAMNTLREQIREDTLWMYLYDVDSSEKYWPEVSVYEPVTLKFYGDRVRVVALAQTFGKQLRNAYLGQILLPLMRRSRFTLTGSTYRSGLVDDVELKMEPSRVRGRRVSDLIHVARDAITLTEAVLREGALTAGAVADLVAADRADLVIGQREGAAFDAKSVYTLDSDAARFEFAKDVAAFANAPEGGLIVVGLRTRKAAHDDMVVAAPKLAVSRSQIAALRGVITSWLFPRPVDVTIKPVVNRDGIGFILIRIPPQPPELQPIFVRRAKLARKLSTEQITVPYRSDDKTEYWDAARLHSLIVAGRAAMARD